MDVAGRQRDAATAATALVAYLGAWGILAAAALAAGIGTTDPRGPLAPFFGLLLLGAPLVAGAASGLVAAAVSRAPRVIAAGLGAAAGFPAFVAWAWSFFAGPFLIVLLATALVAPPGAALLAARSGSAAPGPRWKGPIAGIALLLAFAGVGAAAIHAAQEGDHVVTVVRFRAVEEAPYLPLAVEGVEDADPASWPLSSLEAAAAGEPAEASFLYEGDARAFLARLGEPELARRSREAGIDPPRYFVLFDGAIVEYEIERFVVGPGGEVKGAGEAGGRDGASPYGTGPGARRQAKAPPGVAR